MLCLVCYLFVISTSVTECLGRFRVVPEMTYYVWSGTLNLTKLKPIAEMWNKTQLAVSFIIIEFSHNCFVN